MSARRLSGAGLVALTAAPEDAGTVSRWRAKTVQVPGSECLCWTAAIGGRGHGSVCYAPQRVMIAHRFAFGMVHGVPLLQDVRVLAHRCDNPLFQRIHSEHVVASSVAENRREWAIRRELSGSALRRRARELRGLARPDPALVAADLDLQRALYGEQLPLW